MTLDYFTLSGSFADIGYEPAAGVVRVEASPAFLMDAAGHAVKLSPKLVHLTAGAFSVGLPTDVTTGVSSTIRYRVVVELRGRPPFEVSFWAIPGAGAVDVAAILSGVFPGATLRVLVDTDGVYYYGTGVGSSPVLADTDTIPYVGAADAVGGAVLVDGDGVPYSTV